MCPSPNKKCATLHPPGNMPTIARSPDNTFARTCARMLTISMPARSNGALKRPMSNLIAPSNSNLILTQFRLA